MTPQLTPTTQPTNTPSDADFTIYVSDDMVLQVRRWTAESTQTPYTDDAIKVIIARYPIIDINGDDARYDGDCCLTSINAEDQSLAVNEGWIPTFDLHRAAAEIWEDKMALVVCNYDSNVDGGSLKRSQAFTQAKSMAAYHMSRRNAQARILRIEPYPVCREDVVL